MIRNLFEVSYCHQKVTTLYNVCSVHRGDTMSTSGDILSTLGDVQYIGGYHDSCGGASSYKPLIYIENPDVLMISP